MPGYLDTTPLDLLKKERAHICRFIDKLQKKEGIRPEAKVDSLISELEAKVQEYNVVISKLEMPSIEEKQDTNLTDEQRQKIISDFTEMSGKAALELFYMLGLKTHFQVMFVNDATGEEFIYSLKKVQKII